ncbi:MAG: hypothetical protein GPJ21_10680 [Microcystis aeruginosa W13-11]|nr:hypothetical protein [Microcystis aeruginosa W13-11]
MRLDVFCAILIEQSINRTFKSDRTFALRVLLKQKSKQLLEIETDEETATAWINQQLESLGVKLI